MLRIDQKLLSRLDLEAASKRVIDMPLLEMPRLLSERALEGEERALASATRAIASNGFSPAVEVVGMPKHGLGTRPITIIHPTTRVLFEAVVDQLAGALPESSRDKGIDAHHKFGLEASRADSDLIVDLDIAACYEYIDHGFLSEELLTQSLDSDAVAGLRDLLGSIYPRRVGLPQAMHSSHRLADAYLDPIIRSLSRRGYNVDRYVDDIRIVTQTQTEAHSSIEHVAEEARALGLVLSGQKLEIKDVAKHRVEQAERDDIVSDYRDRATAALQVDDIWSIGYDDSYADTEEGNGEEVDFAALIQIAEDWEKSLGIARGALASFGRLALKQLANGPDRIDDSVLETIVRNEPVRLADVARYLSGRSEADSNWASLARLIHMDRLGPWALLWLFSTASGFPVADEQNSDAAVVIQRAELALGDGSELVRAEAAWLLAKNGNLTDMQLADLFAKSTEVSRIAISAVAGILASGAVAQAIRSHSSLSKKAYQWGNQSGSRIQ